MRLAIALCAATALAAPACAVTVPEPDRPDECRVRHVAYTSDIIRLQVPVHGSLMLILSPEEKEMTAGLASGKWTAMGTGNTLMIAPKPDAPVTNMQLVSMLPDGTARPYTFEMNTVADGIRPSPAPQQVANNGPVAPSAPPPCDAANSPYSVVRVTYAAQIRQAVQAARDAALKAKQAETGADTGPMAPVPLAATTAARRCDFEWRGTPGLLPLAACDTGTQTVFYWPGQLRPPAMFMVGADGGEQSTSPAPDPARPGWMVVNGASPWWRLRLGDGLVTDLYDAAYNPLAEVPAAPARPRRLNHARRRHPRHIAAAASAAP